jgi:hypothetical protein
VSKSDVERSTPSPAWKTCAMTQATNSQAAAANAYRIGRGDHGLVVELT